MELITWFGVYPAHFHQPKSLPALRVFSLRTFLELFAIITDMSMSNHIPFWLRTCYSPYPIWFLLISLHLALSVLSHSYLSTSSCPSFLSPNTVLNAIPSHPFHSLTFTQYICKAWKTQQTRSTFSISTSSCSCTCRTCREWPPRSCREGRVSHTALCEYQTPSLNYTFYSVAFHSFFISRYHTHYHTTPRHTIPYHTIPYHTIPYHATLSHMTRHRTKQRTTQCAALCCLSLQSYLLLSSHLISSH